MKIETRLADEVGTFSLDEIIFARQEKLLSLLKLNLKVRVSEPILECTFF